MGVSVKRAWQGLLVLLMTVIISLNLRILLSINNEEDFSEDVPATDQQCRRLLKYIGAAKVMEVNKSDFTVQWTNFRLNQAKVLGHRRNKPGFLTIGVPSVKRINGNSYLQKTLDSIIHQMSPLDKMDVVVLVFLADFDVRYNDQVVHDLSKRYMEFINMGFIQILQASKDFYPPLTHLKQNYDDKVERVKWRAKQVSDFAFMFLYAKDLSSYYIQLEDDVLCAPNFVWSIRIYIKNLKKHWSVIDFSELGFIGKLFKSSDLEKLARFMLTFYDEQPVDWLIRYFRMAMTQSKVFLRKPTLFQHIGSTSSFDTSKPNNLKDRFFDTGTKKWKSDYPLGSVISDMKAHEENTAELAYSAGNGFFWAIHPSKDQHITLTFDSPEFLRLIAVETGNSQKPNDTLKNAVLEVSLGPEKCIFYKVLGKFLNGRIEVANFLSELQGKPIKCVKIRVLEDQHHWAVIDQIAVFQQNSTSPIASQ